VLRSQIFTCAIEWPSLTSALLIGDGGPLYNFFKGESEIALKCSVLDEGSLEPKGVASWDFAHDVLLDRGDNAGYNFWGHRSLKIWECKKHAKFSTFNDNFGLWAQISLNCIGISTSGKRRYQIQLIPRWMKKLCELSPLTSEIMRLMFTHQNQIFRKAIFRLVGGAAPPNFYTH